MLMHFILSLSLCKWQAMKFCILLFDHPCCKRTSVRYISMAGDGGGGGGARTNFLGKSISVSVLNVKKRFLKNISTIHTRPVRSFSVTIQR